MKRMIVAVDFDGTLVRHKFPDIGPPIPGALETLRELQAQGVKLVLWTMRSGETLEAALSFCKGHGIEFFGVNGNPHQHAWTSSPKAYAQIYIDDAALGCPLRMELEDERPWVDWQAVRELLSALIPLRAKETIVSIPKVPE